jgi:hypothetical protein
LVLGFGLLINCSSVEETPFLLHPFFFSFFPLFADDGGGMDPDCMRQCMSLGFSAKSKSANTIGQCEWNGNSMDLLMNEYADFSSIIVVVPVVCRLQKRNVVNSHYQLPTLQFLLM